MAGAGRAPLVSVVLPVYNAGRYVAESVESVLHQTFQDFELIVVNDGSTDRSEERITPYLGHPRIVYRAKPNGGAASAMNHGIRIARGRYIAIHNADDVCLPTRLEAEVAVLENEPQVEMVYSQVLLFLGAGRPLRHWGGPPRPLPPEETFYRLYEDENFIPNPSVMFKRRHLTHEDPFPEGYRIGEDYVHHLRVAHDYPLHFIEKPLVLMRQDDEHEHLMRDVETMFRADRAVHRQIYREFCLREPRLTRRHYARAMRNQCFREVSFYLDSGQYGRALRRLGEASRHGPFDARLGRLFLMLVAKPVVPAPLWQSARRVIRSRRAVRTAMAVGNLQ